MVSEKRATPSRAALRWGDVWLMVSDNTFSEFFTVSVSHPEAAFVTSKKAS
jgi:hypothetical protein